MYWNINSPGSATDLKSVNEKKPLSFILNISYSENIDHGATSVEENVF